MLNFKNVEIPVFFSGPGPVGGAFSAPPDPLAHQTGYHTNLPRLSKSPHNATAFWSPVKLFSQPRRFQFSQQTSECTQLGIGNVLKPIPLLHAYIIQLFAQLRMVTSYLQLLTSLCRILNSIEGPPQSFRQSFIPQSYLIGPSP